MKFYLYLCIFIGIFGITMLGSCKRNEIQKDVTSLLMSQDTTIKAIHFVNFTDNGNVRKQVAKLDLLISQHRDTLKNMAISLRQDSISIMSYADKLDSLIYTFKRRERPKVIRDFEERKDEFRRKRAVSLIYQRAMPDILDSLQLLKQKLENYPDREYNKVIPNDIVEMYNAELRITKLDTTYNKCVEVTINTNLDYKTLQVK